MFIPEEFITDEMRETFSKHAEQMRVYHENVRSVVNKFHVEKWRWENRRPHNYLYETDGGGYWDALDIYETILGEVSEDYRVTVDRITARLGVAPFSGEKCSSKLFEGTDGRKYVADEIFDAIITQEI